jgi:hypothetical protein
MKMWTVEYIFICTKGAAAVCIARNKNITALKEYNIKMHYKIKHASKLSGIRALGKDKSTQLQTHVDR